MDDAELQQRWAEQRAQEAAEQAAKDGKIAPQSSKAAWIRLRQLKRIAEVKKKDAERTAEKKPKKYPGRPRGTQLTPEQIEEIRRYLEIRAAEIRVFIDRTFGEETWNEAGDNARRHNNNWRRTKFREEWEWVCRQYNISWAKLRRVLGTNTVELLDLKPGNFRLMVNRDRRTFERLQREWEIERQNKKTSPQE